MKIHVFKHGMVFSYIIIMVEDIVNANIEEYRTFKCDCGVEMDRDVHAAQNMVWFYENNVGVERTKIKRMEMKALVDQALAKENQLLSAKYEDSSL